MNDEERETAAEAGGPESVKPSRLWPRVRFLLTLAMMAMLARGWVYSMRNYSESALGLGSAALQVNSFAGSVSLSLSPPPPAGAVYFYDIPSLTQLNQETLFPRPKLCKAPASSGPSFHFVVVPYWLLMMAAFFLWIAVPGAWRRWKRPASRGRLASWCTGWVVLALALISGGRWWGLRQPRIDETSHFRLTGANELDLAMKGKMHGVATGQDGSPLSELGLLFANAGYVVTDGDGKFEVPYTTGEVLCFVGARGTVPDEVKISIDPDRPMYWRIQKK